MLFDRKGDLLNKGVKSIFCKLFFFCYVSASLILYYYTCSYMSTTLYKYFCTNLHNGIYMYVRVWFFFNYTTFFYLFLQYTIYELLVIKKFRKKDQNPEIHRFWSFLSILLSFTHIHVNPHAHSKTLTSYNDLLIYVLSLNFLKQVPMVYQDPKE